MADRPSVLVLDDGELDNVHRMLRRMEIDVRRLKGVEIGSRIDAPIDLLITSGKRTLNSMPELAPSLGSGAGPVWVCIHNQDFLPMRERLGEMGVHYLLQNALDEESRERFVTQLLRKGVERRRDPRLPLGGEIEWGTETPSESGKLVELSADGCQILTSDQPAVDTLLSVRLPPALGGGEELDLVGRVLRAAEPTMHAGHAVYLTAIRFEALDSSKRSILKSVLGGEQIGTRITVLADMPETSAPDAAVDDDSKSEPGAGDRRSAPRQAYGRSVQILGEPEPVLGCDLSMTGVRLRDCEDIDDGTQVTVALFGAPRDEPIVVDAVVTRAGVSAEAALRFGDLTPSQKQGIEKLLRSTPILDALDQPTAAAGRTVVAELRDANAT